MLGQYASPGPPGATSLDTRIMPATPPPSMLAPPEGIFRSFEELLSSVQRTSKEQGYGIVKLRASNYRDSKPSRYDLVCDRGGVKYQSTAKKRNPSSRKVDCPFRAKAVCEVQLGGQWRFAVQDSRHNHDPRTPAEPPAPEAAPINTSIRSLTNKVERLGHDLNTSMEYIKRTMEAIEKRLDSIEARGGVYEQRFQHIDQRLQNVESGRMDGMEMDDVETRLLASSIV